MSGYFLGGQLPFPTLTREVKMWSPFQNIEPFVITSNKKTKSGHWLWTRNCYEAATGLARTIVREFMNDKDKDITITVLDVANGCVEVFGYVLESESKA